MMLKKLESADFGEIEPEDLKTLKSKGYVPVSHEGEGNTRTVWKVKRELPGGQSIYFAATIPKQIDTKSFTTVNNFSNGDRNIDEIKVLTKLNHPNIVKLHDAFEGKYGAIVVQENVDGGNLAEYSKFNNHKRENILHPYRQLIDTVHHLNIEKDILHRDIKPDNVLITKDGRIKLADMQNARSIDDILEHSLPTKGGTAYSKPKLINSILSGDILAMTLSDESYATTSTGLHMAHGKKPFDYSLYLTDEGQKMVIENLDPNIINSKKFKDEVYLMINGKIEKAVTPEIHKRNVEKSIDLLSKEFRFYEDFFHKGLVGEGFKDIKELKKEFYKADKSISRIVVDGYKRVEQGLWSSVATAGTMCLLIGGLSLLSNEERQTYNVRETPLKVQDISKSNITSLTAPPLDTRKGTLDLLDKKVEEIKESYKENGEKWKPIEYLTENDERITKIAIDKKLNKRIFNAVIAASLSEDEHLPGKSTAFYLPDDRYRARARDHGARAIENELNLLKKTANHVSFLSNRNDYLDDLMANYFSGETELYNAQYGHARSTNYFSVVDTTGGILDGYHIYLTPGARELSLSALAWFSLIGEDGKPNLNAEPNYSLDMSLNNGLDVK